MDLADYLLPDSWPTDPDGPALSAYLLGIIGFDDAQRLQRKLHFDVTGGRDQAALVLCEHPPLITVGRHGSARHIHLAPRDLYERGWSIRWVKRGGGCWLHLPGQLSIYLVAPLDVLRLSVPEFSSRLSEAIRRVLADFSVRGPVSTLPGGVAVNSRLVANLGFAVHDWATTFGACFNLRPDLDPYHLVRSYPAPEQAMTSLERERRGPVRPALVRQRLLEHLVALFGFSRVSLFTAHPLLENARRCDNVPVRVSS
ncbi:MAG: hypothetical protein U0793_04090 [Gemmataceae bacterium]